MIQSIFARPLFINPTAYAVIPELALLSKATMYDFSDTSYVFQVITKGLVEIKMLEAGSDYIMHIDLYDDLGCGVLGEFYINGSDIANPDNISIDQSNGMITIDFGGGNPDDVFDSLLLESGDSVLFEDSEYIRLERKP